MTTRKPSVFKTEILICSRKYSIVDSDGKTVFDKISIPFMTEDGFFAAPLPEGVSYEEFKNYEGCEIQELPYEQEDVFHAGKIEKCTYNGFYGRFYKDCIHRAKETYNFCYTIRSSKWAEASTVGLWSYNNKFAHPIVFRGEITSFSKDKKSFIIDVSDNYEKLADLMYAVVMQRQCIIGVIIKSQGSEISQLQCISTEILLREMCQHKEYIEHEISEGHIEKEKESDFIIHNGVLERYQGASDTVIVPEGVHTIGKDVFYINNGIRNITLPTSLKRIEKGAFQGCVMLETIELPYGLEFIGQSAFCYCSALKSVVIPDTVKTIESDAFSFCESLSLVELSKSIVTLSEGIFRDCETLKAITIPDSVQVIEDGAFSCCKKLSDIQIKPYVKVANENVFLATPWLKKHLKKNGTLILGGKLLAVSENLTEYKIPEDVTAIGELAFWKSNIDSLIIPENIESIEIRAFERSNIKHITLPRNIKRIEERTFADCKCLEELTIPKSVDFIGTCALYNLPNCVLTILNDREDVDYIGDYSFGDKEEYPACVKEVRGYHGSKAMCSARLWNLPCAYL